MIYTDLTEMNKKWKSSSSDEPHMKNVKITNSFATPQQATQATLDSLYIGILYFVHVYLITFVLLWWFKW